MFKNKYRIDNELIKPDDDLLTSLSATMKEYSKENESTNETMIEDLKDQPIKHHNKFMRYGSLAACFIILTLSIATIGSLIGSKKNTKSLSEDFIYKESIESATDSVEDSNAKKAPLYSTTDNDDKKDGKSENKQAETEVKNAEIPMESSATIVAGYITISADMVDTIVVTDPLSSAHNEIIINSKLEIVELINSINSLTLTKADELSIADRKDNKLTQLKILYKDISKEDNLYLTTNFVFLNDGDVYEMEETEASNLNAILESLK